MKQHDEIEVTRDGRRVKTGFRNFPMVPRVIYGRGCFSQLDDILLPKRKSSESPFVFLVDDYFEHTGFVDRIPTLFNDCIIFVSADEEPKTDQVDALVEKIINDYEEQASGVVGIGGGSILDLAKAVSILLNNPGQAEKYQGWDLVSRPALYHVGVPTISGTGAEVSRTAVLSGPTKKLGINSDHTTYDQVLLDPDLVATVPKEQWFYTGMDCFIHCVESLQGTYLNAFSQSYGEKAFDLCKEVFLDNLETHEAEEKLMMASWHGGMSIAYSQVGVAHALSYGLSHILGVKHGLGNCLVFRHLYEFYPEGVTLFDQMLKKHQITLPEAVCSALSEADLTAMATIALSMEPLWENALGPQWQEKISLDRIIAIYKKI